MGLGGNKLIVVLRDIFDWYPSHYPPAERKLLRKLDAIILSFTMLSFLAKTLNTSNLSNAYVSGMQEELHLDGNDLNYLTMCFNAAYLVGQIPLGALLTRPSLQVPTLTSPWIFPTLEILWGVITFSTAAVKNVNQLYGIRALIGFLEAPAYAGTHFYLGSWYKKEEIFKRAGLWFCSNFIANIISGYLQAAAYRNLNGVHGLAGWRWLFIVDGAYTVPIALIGYLTFPGIPSSRKKWVFSEEEWALAKSRMPKDHSQAGKYTWSTVKRGLTSRIWYIGTTSYVCLALGPWWTTTNFSLWLKSEKTYSVELINILPTFYSVIGVFTCFFGTVLAGNNILKPWLVFFVTQGILIFSLILLTVWYIPAGLKLFAFYLGGFCGPTSPILYSWVNITLRNDPELRSFTMASMMTAGFIGNLWIPLLTFPTKSAPRFPKGYPTAIGLNTFFLFSWGYGFWLYRHANTQVGNDDNAVTSSDSDAKSVEEKSVGERDEVPQLNAVANRVQ